MDGQGRMSEMAVNCRVVANNTEVMLEIALAGFGIVYGPSFVFAKHLERGELVPVNGVPGTGSASFNPR